MRTVFADTLGLYALFVAEDSEHERALAALLAASKRGVSPTDWTSIELMRSREIQTAFVLNEHLEERGFGLLSPTS